MECSKCKKDIESVIGVSIIVSIQNNAFEEDLKRQFGKYPVASYNFCYECWLDSLFGGKDATI